MTDELKSCVCDGSNENCRYCFGTGIRKPATRQLPTEEGDTSVPELNVSEKELISLPLSFYQELATGRRKPDTKAQRHFVAAVNGGVRANSDHEKAYLKYLEIQRLQRDARSRRRS